MAYKKALASVLFLSVSSMISVQAPAHAGAFIIGKLICSSFGDSNQKAVSSNGLSCQYRPADKSVQYQRYTGHVNNTHVNSGTSQYTKMVWAVVADAQTPNEQSSLTGTFNGGANIVSNAGSQLSGLGGVSGYSLRPLSIGTHESNNFALNVSQVTLSPILNGG